MGRFGSYNLLLLAMISTGVLANSDAASLEAFGTSGISINYDSYQVGDNSENWMDTSGDSLIEDGDLFQIFDLNGEKVMGTSSVNETNIHSHYLLSGASWSNYRYSGRMQIGSASDSIGVTFYSDYPNSDSYYRLRSIGGESFYIAPHGAAIECSGDTNSGVSPDANQWYRFNIEVESMDSTTEVRANVWLEGSDEPEQWQISCSDTDTRLTAGAIGVWAVVDGADAGNKYWDDISVVSLTAESENVGVNLDSDFDGITDSWEIEHFGSLDVAGINSDNDADGVLDRDEFILGTDPKGNDTDGDGISDGNEVIAGSDPTLTSEYDQASMPVTPSIFLTEQIIYRDTVLAGSSFIGSDASAKLFLSQWVITRDDDVVLNRTVEKSSQLKVPLGVLEYGVNYDVKVRYFDNNLVSSLWSEKIQFYVVSNGLTDFDENGIVDSYQVSGNIDINQNSFPDIDENICHLKAANDSSIIGLKSLSGEINCQTVIPVETANRNLISDMKVPDGFMTYTVTRLDLNYANPAQVIVRIYYPDNIDATSGWFNYDSVNNEVSDVSNSAEFSGKIATIYIQDGSEGDADGIVNGMILVSGGLSVPAALVAAQSIDTDQVEQGISVARASTFYEFALMSFGLLAFRKRKDKLVK